MQRSFLLQIGNALQCMDYPDWSLEIRKISVGKVFVYSTTNKLDPFLKLNPLQKWCVAGSVNINQKSYAVNPVIIFNLSKGEWHQEMQYTILSSLYTSLFFIINKQILHSLNHTEHSAPVIDIYPICFCYV